MDKILINEINNQILQKNFKNKCNKLPNKYNLKKK